MEFHPKNSIKAIGFFIFGSFFVWWSYDKINVFTSVFTNTFPKIIVWASFLMLFATWLFIIPWITATGAEISIAQFLSVFVNGFIGLLVIILILPIGQTLITALSNMFHNQMVDAIGWISIMAIIMYASFYRPLECFIHKEEGA